LKVQPQTVATPAPGFTLTPHCQASQLGHMIHRCLLDNVPMFCQIIVESVCVLHTVFRFFQIVFCACNL